MKDLKRFLDGKIVRVENTDCVCVVRKYTNGQIFMQLLESYTGAPYRRVSLSIDEIPAVDNMIIVKSYSENKGIYEAILSAGIIKPAERKYAVGLENAHICFFNIPNN